VTERSYTAPDGRTWVFRPRPEVRHEEADTHVTLPVISRSRALLWKEDLLPYRRLRQKLPVVMAGHAYYPAIQGDSPSPATLSGSVAAGLLRRKVGYRGLIVTDDLEMGAVDQAQGAGHQAMSALAAGHDGLMFCGSEEKIREAYETLLAAVREGKIDTARVGLSVRRILRLKDRFLCRRRRAPYSPELVVRSRRALASLGAGADSGHDPTARL